MNEANKTCENSQGGSLYRDTTSRNAKCPDISECTSIFKISHLQIDFFLHIFFRNGREKLLSKLAIV